MAPAIDHSSPVGATTRRHRLRVHLIVVLFCILFSGCICEANRDDIRRQEVVEGGNVTLTCYAQPTKLKAYRWVYIRAGTQRPQVLSSGRRLVVGEPRISLVTKGEDSRVALELTLSDVRPYESGLFMCWRQGQKPDPQVLLTVLEPGTAPEQQVIRQSNGPSEVKYGASATFFCVITPSWPVKVTWSKNGEVIPITDRLYSQNVEKSDDPFGDRQVQEEKLVATLTVTSIRKDSVFTCRIDSNPPDQKDMPVKVLVPRVESLNADPDKDLVEYGQPLAITCVVSGTDSEILWLKDGMKLSFGPHSPGREIYASAEDANRIGSTVYIESMSFRDNGHYVCYIPGASKNILINIEGRAPRLLGVTGGDFFEDDTLSLRCTTQYMKHSQEGDFRWQFDNTDIDLNLYRFREYQTEYNVTVHELTIPRAGSQNVGTYNCITPYGTAEITVNMFVPPSLGEPLPSEVQVREGDTVQIACNAVGSPPPAITWERRTGDAWLPIDRATGVQVGVDGNLRIPAASLGDSGNYRCAAQSEAGSFLADVIVTVSRAGPEVFDIIAPQNVIVGDNFTIQCTIINWDGEVEFSFRESPLNSLGSSRHHVDSYPTADGMNQMYLTIQDATVEDSGRYSCNAGSYDSSSIVVEVHERPAEILDLFFSPAILNRDFFITCIVLNGPKKVTFYQNGSPIPVHEDSRHSVQSVTSSLEEMTHILKVPTARQEDKGTYECAADTFGRTSVEVVIGESTDEVFGIEATPAIMGRDFNVTCTVKDWDGEVTFIHNNVVVDDAKDWRYDVLTFPSEISEHMSTHTLMISGVTEQDEGTYECYTTPHTYRSTVVSVWQLVDVKLELQARDRPNWRDSPIPINCLVEGVNPDTVTVLFSHFNEPQVSIQNRTKMATSDHLVNIAISENDSGKQPSTTFTLGFYSLSTDLTGVWSCEVLLPSGHIIGQDNLFLEIEEPPKFAENISEEVYVDSDQDLMLNCSSKGSPDIIVSWHRAGIPEPIERRRQSATLFIPAFTSMDAGDYYCSISFLDREIRAKTTLVLRTPQPRVESVTSSPAVRGQIITVTCTVSYWNGQVLFLHNTNSVDPEQNPRYVTRQRAHGRREPNTISHTLTIKDATLQDSGMVECFISFEVFGSTNITVTGEEEVTPTPGDPSDPVIAPGRIVELRGPDRIQVGGTLALTCLVSPVIQQDVVLAHDVFLLHAGGLTITEDPRLQIITDAGNDGSKIIYLTIREVTTDDAGAYQCTTSTDPPAMAVKEVIIVPLDGIPEPEGGEQMITDCSIYATCLECVTTPFPCRWCMDSHRCVNDVEEECSQDVIVFGKDDGVTQTRSGQNNCPVIMKDPSEIVIHNGEARAVYLDSKNIGEEKTFDNAKFKCHFNIGGREVTVKARLWYSYIYCDEVTFEYSSSLPEVKVPLEVLWDNSKPIDNPDNIHVTVYSCALMAETCKSCQDLHEKYNCGWCTTRNTCEVDGLCPVNEWIEPSDLCSADVFPEREMTLYGTPEIELFVQPSDRVVLPCTAGLHIDLEAPYWDRKYNIKWTRELDGDIEMISENNILDISAHDRPRYALHTDAGQESGNSTKYDLVISPIQVGEFGLYRCSLSDNNNVTVSKAVQVTSEDTPHYDRCQLPDHWTGQWYATYDDYSIYGNNFGNTVCISSLGNKYLLRNQEYGCNICFIINENHPNILEYKESACSGEEDLNTLCSLVEDHNLTILKRKNAVIQCPFPGRRVFTYKTANEECGELPSTIISEKDNTELVFWYQPCEGNEDEIYYSNKVECMAAWEKDSTFYLMGKLEKLPNRAERYRCYTYKEAHDQEHHYIMSETGSETCGELGVNAEKTYKIFNAAIAPGQPTIEGYGSTIQVTEGFTLQLKCSSYGGLPLATVRWLHNGQEVTSAKHQLDDRTEAILDIQVQAWDDGAEYTCEATNTATSSPLITTTVLSFSKDEYCVLPSEWVGRWYQVNNDRYVDITQQEFSNSPCTASLGQNYMLHDMRKDCNRCAVITEKHPNILYYKRSKCKPSGDFNELCSEITEESYILVRRDTQATCPWVGARSFSFQTAFGGCSESPSQMYSFENDAEMMMFYNPCPEQDNPNIAPYSERVRCIGDWSAGDDDLRYFMGELVNFRGPKQEQYRCFTYTREEDGRQLFRASRLESGMCGPLARGRNAEYSYKLYGLSEAPSAPVIEGHSSTDPVQAGDELQLTCVTYGGFPTPNVQWYRDGEPLESETYSRNDRHETKYSLAVSESDKRIQYQCRVSNYVTKPELTANLTLSFQDDISSMLQEPRETRLAVIPSEIVVLKCTALLSMQLDKYWDLPYKMRWVYYGNEEQKSLTDMHIMEFTDSRFSLYSENNEEENLTHYDLTIDPVRLTDEGTYECHMWDDTRSFAHQVHLAVGGTTHYDDCEFPDTWNGQWFGEQEDYEISDNNNISGRICKQSLGNKYLLKNEYRDCNECYVIDEKHPNLLRVKASICSHEEDLAILCSLIDSDWRWMMMKNASTRCPLSGGAHPFTHQDSYEGCNDQLSKMYSTNYDTELVFEYNRCTNHPFSDIQVNPRRVECLATWSEGSTQYLMGRWENVLDASQEQFRCYSLEEATEESHIYDMSQSGSSRCSRLYGAHERYYNIFDESVVPGEPSINGYDPTEHKEVGDPIELFCVTEGGFPSPTLRWFRGEDELRTETRRDGDTSEARLEIVLEEEEIDYRCEASNMATSQPLVNSVTVSSIRGIVKILKSQVMAVEGQNVFLPCARILDNDLQMEWFDADLDIKLTSGNETISSNDTLGYDSNYFPYIKNDLFGLIINSGFLDTKYGCVVNDQRVGNTTLVILPSFLVTREEYEMSDYFEETDVMVEANQNTLATLNCTLKPGMKPVAVSWRRYPDAQLLTQDDINLVEDEGYRLEVVSLSYLLEIPKAQSTHSGSYICQAILSDTKVYTSNFSLVVQDVVKGNLGHDTRISCLSPMGEPVIFLYKEEVLNPDIGSSRKYSWDQEDVIDQDGNITVLIITDTTKDDAGVYTCVKAEHHEEILQQTVLGFASEVMLNISNLRVITVEGTDVLLAWEPPTDDPFANIDVYEILYFERNHEDDAVTVIAKNETYLVRILDEEVEYGFQVRVKTDMGWGAFSEPVFQKTGKYFELEDPESSTTPANVDEELSTTLSPTEVYTDAEEVTEEDGETISGKEEEEIEKEPAEVPEVAEEEEEGEQELQYYDYDDFEEVPDIDIDYYEEEEKIPQTIYKKVILPCGDFTDAEDITWNRGNDTLFLGALDLVGVEGLSLSSNAELILAEGPVADIRDNDVYTCYHFDLKTFEDLVVVTYHVSLHGEETRVKKVDSTHIEETPPGLQFGLEEEVAVLANSERVGNKIMEVLQSGGLKVRLLDISKCNATDVRGWPNAEKAMLACEAFARLSGDLTDDESIFMGFDFFVELMQSSWFAVTRLYLNNVKKDVSVNVFAPMIPVPKSNITPSDDPDEPARIQVSDDWWNTVQGVDKSSGSGLTASILSLQETYLNRINAKST